MHLLFELVTPERLVFRQEIDQATIPTQDGEITILPHHTALVANIAAGVMHVMRGAEEEDIAVSGGVVEISEGGRVRVLAETAERGHELEVEAIEAAKLRAEKVMAETVRTDDVSFAAAAAALARETARLKTAQKYRSHGRRLSNPGSTE